ncbi:MAG: TIGR03620 family F420-dependent LLM class oxidoreductase [Candidatus Binataceae bacterium]
MQLKGLGIFAFLDAMSGPETARFARTAESLGYEALWYPEWYGRESFTHAAYLLGATERLIIATGIANVFKRSAVSAISAANTLAEIYPERFVLGLGVSHAPSNARRGIDYQKPLTHMREYLAAMKEAPYTAPPPRTPAPVVLAALLPKMLELAGETSGTHTYFVSPEHTARARKIVGPDKWVCAAQAVILEADEDKGRAAAHAYVNHYIKLPNYQRHLNLLGFEESDYRDGASDRLASAIVAWGTAAKIRERIAEHRAAGASHVCILPLRPVTDEPPGLWFPDMKALAQLAPSA